MDLKAQLAAAQKKLTEAEQREQAAERLFFASPTKENEDACIAAVDQRNRAALHVKRAKALVDEETRKQVVTTTRPIRTPLAFGSEKSLSDWLAAVEEQRKRQRTRYAIAPKCGIELPSGTRVREGMSVDAPDFAGHPTKSATQLLEEYVRSGHIVDKEAA